MSLGQEVIHIFFQQFDITNDLVSVSKFCAVLRTAQHVDCDWEKRRHTLSGRCDNSPPSVPVLIRTNPISSAYVLILSSHLRLCLSSSLFPAGFLYTPLFPARATCSVLLAPLNLNYNIS